MRSSTTCSAWLETTRAHDAIAAQHVCEEYQRGYMLHDRLLRPALVIVSSGPAN
jgi:molecular chaperone GrpE (heat shock protein)